MIMSMMMKILCVICMLTSFSVGSQRGGVNNNPILKETSGFRMYMSYMNDQVYLYTDLLSNGNIDRTYVQRIISKLNQDGSFTKTCDPTEHSTGVYINGQYSKIGNHEWMQLQNTLIQNGVIDENGRIVRKDGSSVFGIPIICQYPNGERWICYWDFSRGKLQGVPIQPASNDGQAAAATPRTQATPSAQPSYGRTAASASRTQVSPRSGGYAGQPRDGSDALERAGRAADLGGAITGGGAGPDAAAGFFASVVGGVASVLGVSS